MKGIPKSFDQRKKMSDARKRWLNHIDQETLNKIYTKMARTKKKNYQEGLTIPWNKNKKLSPLSEEQKRKISDSLKGRKPTKKQIRAIIIRNKTNNPMWNPESVKKAVMKRNYKEIARKTTLTKLKKGTFLEYSKRMKKNNPMKNPIINAKVNKNPEYIKKRISSLIKKPNKPEKLLIEIINKNNFPFIYVGDGRKIIGSKNPDFIHKSDKKIIELFGDYWHTQRVRCFEETEKGRKEYFKKHGYKTLVLWEKELKDIEDIIKKISIFDKNNPLLEYQ